MSNDLITIQSLGLIINLSNLIIVFKTSCVLIIIYIYTQLYVVKLICTTY